MTSISNNHLHFWLLLADSALPIGSFAFSSGLESYIAHRTILLQSQNVKINPRTELDRFLHLSCHSLASTTIPYVSAAYNHPADAIRLDDEFDASTTCSVARRASVSMGKALMTVWDKSFAPAMRSKKPSVVNGDNGLVKEEEEEDDYINQYRAAIRTSEASGHLGVSWGLLCQCVGLPYEHVLFVFMFNHVKAVVSAAVRQGLVGPYVAQTVLAREETRLLVESMVEYGKGIDVEMAGQTVPTVDIYQGRHELLYSRVFNS